MKMSNKIINILLIILLSIITIYLFISYGIYLNNIMKFLLFVLYLLFVFALYEKRNDLLIVSYFVFLFIVLFVRDKVDTNINEKNYLLKWVRLMFKNKIIFINLIGNVVLYMPFSWYIMGVLEKIKIKWKSIICMLLSLFIIIFFEILQMISFRGVFDFNDIILNIIGTLIIILIYNCIEVFRYGKTEKR